MLCVQDIIGQSSATAVCCYSCCLSVWNLKNPFTRYNTTTIYDSNHTHNI